MGGPHAAEVLITHVQRTEHFMVGSPVLSAQGLVSPGCHGGCAAAWAVIMDRQYFDKYLRTKVVVTFPSLHEN